MAGSFRSTSINDLPDVILSNVIATVSDVRSRNAAALVCRKWMLLERSTRVSLTLRGNARDLFMLPSCFRSVTRLDLSLLSPWGHSLLSSSSDPALIAHLLRHYFPSTTSLTLYSRTPLALQLLASQWPDLKEIKLVRWHQRPPLAPGSDLIPIYEYCGEVRSLDLSRFYCWTDDVLPAIESKPHLSAKLTRLDLLNPSLAEGFKAQEIDDITKLCPNLNEFLVVCTFNPRYIGFVGDSTLLSLSSNCPKLSKLHLADTSALLNARGGVENEGYSQEDARITVAALIEFFSGLPLLEDLTLDVCNNVRESAPAIETLHSKCPNLKRLKLSHFHGICLQIDSKLDGLALCQRLESLSIHNSADLTDMGLIALGRGCSKLTKFEVQGCKKITMKGMRTLACLLRKTLEEVKISCCKNLGATSSLKAVEPIQDKIRQLQIDCVWDSVEQCETLSGVEYNFDLNKLDESPNFFENDEMLNTMNKKCKFSNDANNSGDFRVDGGNGYGNGFSGKPWEKLRYLSLWFPVGELLTPLALAGLADCSNLEEIRIKVEGDCRNFKRPSPREFGLSCLSLYPKLTKMHLDCGDIIGYAHTAPSGQMDLSLWERFYLLGIGDLELKELDYWPPQDRDVNQRSLSLPAAGLLQECLGLRKLFIHGTAHEHFMKFLLRIPNLRDVQLREDYYPAPENDMSTEMRADSCSRFEDALNRRRIDD